MSAASANDRRARRGVEQRRLLLDVVLQSAPDEHAVHGPRAGQEVVEVRAVRLAHVDVQRAAGARDPQQVGGGALELRRGDRVGAARGDRHRAGRLQPAELVLVVGRELPGRGAEPMMLNGSPYSVVCAVRVVVSAPRGRSTPCTRSAFAWWTPKLWPSSCPITRRCDVPVDPRLRAGDVAEAGPGARRPAPGTGTSRACSPRAGARRPAPGWHRSGSRRCCPRRGSCTSRTPCR